MAVQRDWSLILGHEPGLLTLVLIAGCLGLALIEIISVVRRGAAGKRRGLIAAAPLASSMV